MAYALNTLAFAIISAGAVVLVLRGRLLWPWERTLWVAGSVALFVALHAPLLKMLGRALFRTYH